ncbi:two component transcriptional regulator, AraC family [Candidatus Moduliflexus flocculans]|uniref:Two component transcriptional regulator, AraC family n=1 Tax=Candidatus Moduliflexus flocculans TaxID=1499966 RepID=A0A0S6W4M1_9BACT|nr:two component transcriptional regulator, AraC family [Candidatus Moduliflexus flocculans]
MHQVLVVDDEPLVRLALKNMRDWEEFGFFFAAEAAHGKQALEILQGNPAIDIVILDITMPVMNGLEVIQQLHACEHPPEILILSCHNEFEFVRQAFKSGVHDYVLKSEMEPETMLAHLQTIANRLDAVCPRSGAHGDALIEQKYLRRRFLRDLISGQSTPDLLVAPLQTGIQRDDAYFCVAAVNVQQFDHIRQRYQAAPGAAFVEQALDCMAQVLDRQALGEAISLTEDRYALLFALDALNAASGERIAECVKEIEQALRHYLDMTISFRISRIEQGVRSIPLLYLEATQPLLESRIVKRAKRYVQEHFHDPELCLSEISEFVGITKNHLSHQFAKETGEHLRDYIHRLRIEEAKRRFQKGDVKVYEVCYDVGYKNVESFSRMFKKLTGQSPNLFSQQTSEEHVF